MPVLKLILKFLFFIHYGFFYLDKTVWAYRSLTLFLSWRSYDTTLWSFFCYVFPFRLAELRDVIVELRNKQDQETQERRMLDQQTQLK